jgi:hypothetical protein
VTFPAGAIWCEFVNGKPVLAWLNVEFVHKTVSWQDEQSDVGNPAVMWFGTAPPNVGVLFQAVW